MNVVAWVPIKMNNERLPGKNILPLGGKPLCQHVLGELMKLEDVSGVYAFCSEKELDKYLPEGVERISRDVQLNSFQTKINDVIQSFSEKIDADVYVYAQVTSPFLKVERIAEGLNKVISGEYDSALSVKVLRDFLWDNKEQPLNYDPSDISRTQDLNPFYQETGGFYIYTKELIEKYNRRTGFRPYLVELNETESVDIDYREDYELAQSIILNNKGRENDLYNIKILEKWVSFVENGGSFKSFFDKFGFETCAIYGDGVLGNRLYKSLLKEGVSVECFIDKEYENEKRCKIYKPEELGSVDGIDLIIITPGYDEKSIRNSLGQVDSFVVNMETLFSENYEEMIREMNKQNRLDYAINEYFWRESALQYDRLLERYENTKMARIQLKSCFDSIVLKKLVLPRVELVVTTKCSLNCKNCFAGIPLYSDSHLGQYDIPLDTLKSDLLKLLSGVDYIVQLNILGGEPLLYDNIDELLSWLAGVKNIGMFSLVTNSTIIPRDSTCDLLRNKRFHIYVNDYGMVESNVEAIEKKLLDYGIMYTKQANRVWYDFGDASKKEMSVTELQNHYKECSYNVCRSLMEGELYLCEFHCHRTKIQIVPDFSESLRIHDYDDIELRERIVDFYKSDYYNVCMYCNAPNRSKSKRIIAGEQF